MASLSHRLANAIPPDTTATPPIRTRRRAINIIAATPRHALEAFKLRWRAKPDDQSLAREPGGRTVNAIFAVQHLCLRARVYGTAIGKRGMQSREVNTRLTRVPVDHRGIPEILAESEVRREEISM